MAMGNLRFTTAASFVYPAVAADISHEDQDPFEFEEADIIFHESYPFAAINPMPSSRYSRKNTRTVGSDTGRTTRNNSVASASAPMSIPDWSKILKESYVKRGKRDSDDDEYDDVEYSGEDEGNGIRIPPHEYLARRKGDSFSVHEGIGRTLKGRDLSRVRNAVWKTTGFAD